MTSRRGYIADFLVDKIMEFWLPGWMHKGWEMSMDMELRFCCSNELHCKITYCHLKMEEWLLAQSLSIRQIFTVQILHFYLGALHKRCLKTVQNSPQGSCAYWKGFDLLPIKSSRWGIIQLYRKVIFIRSPIFTPA